MTTSNTHPGISARGLRRALLQAVRNPSTTRIRRHTFRPRLDALEERQLLSAGDLDIANFNPPNGYVLTPFTSKGSYSTYGEAHAVQIQSDGKIVAAGVGFA